MKIFIKIVFLLGLSSIIIFSGCKKDDIVTFIDPADADALTRVIIIPDANGQDGNPPGATGEANAPIITGNLTEILSSNGGTVPLTFSYSNVQGKLSGSHLQIVGATDYFFSLPFNGDSGSSGTLTIPITLPTNLLEGQFCVKFWVYDDENRISNVLSTCVNVIVLGSGSLQISLSWDTATDQDLYVLDPSGFQIYYANSESPTGGLLDRDDTSGYGPENIYWLENAPDGEYKVEVNSYSYTTTPNNFFVTVNAPGKTKTFTGQTINGNTVTIVTIVKSGDNYEF